MKYSTIVIIYNPNSTGPSKSLATDLKKRITKQIPSQKNVRLVATKYAGHGEEIAYEIAMSSKNPLIISSSGDGGYHEIINGAMRAQEQKATPTVGLLPGGNANDHYENLHSKDIVELIRKAESRTIDLLHLSAQSEGEPFNRYAHSYIGIGLTPWVGKELTKAKLNFFNQITISLKAFFSFQPVKIHIKNTPQSYSSIIFSNIDVMAKVLRVSRPSKIDDGVFEVTIFRKNGKLRLLTSLLKASMSSIHEDLQESHYEFKTIQKTLVQLDGEVFKIDADTKTTIQSKQKILKCII
jgi:diacylglycerol kinase family enzyme